MDFTFDADQEALRDVARQALEREVGPDRLRAMVDDPTLLESLWDRLVDLGWTGLLVPADHHGAGAGLLETGIVLEQMGRVPLPGPFLSSAVAATLAARALGAADLLYDLADGSRRGTVAVGEIGYGDPLATVRSRARRRGAGWVLSGHKPLVLDGGTADWIIVVARTEDGIRSFLLEPPRTPATDVSAETSPDPGSSGAGVDMEEVPTLDPTRRVWRLLLEEAPAVPIGPTGPQGALWRRVLDDLAVAIASELVGVADRALSEATSYATERVVFDRPIATFQVVKHRLVDMFHSLEMARAGAQFAAWASDTESPDRERAAAMAASYAAAAAVRVSGDNIQTHGGVGFTWANDAHFLYKRAKQNEILLGGAGHQRRRLAAMLVGHG